MSDDPSVAITLSVAQIAMLLRKLVPSASVTAFLDDLGDERMLRSSVRRLMDDSRLSNSLLRSLLVLAAFPTDGSERRVTDVADELGWSTSTTHRYVDTWAELGVLERNPNSRRYSRA